MSDSAAVTISIKGSNVGYSYEKMSQELQSLLDEGQREEVISVLKDVYSKDSDLASSLANSLNIDMQELGIIYHYQDSNITAKEIINDDNTSTLIIESNTNLLEYQGNTADTLMAGLSGIFNSMATLARKTKERIA